MKRLLFTVAALSLSTTVLAAEAAPVDTTPAAPAVEAPAAGELTPEQLARIGVIAEEGQARAAALQAAGDSDGAELANLETMLAILEVLAPEPAP